MMYYRCNLALPAMGCGGPRPVSTHEVAVEIALVAHAASSNLHLGRAKPLDFVVPRSVNYSLTGSRRGAEPATTLIDCGMRQYRTEPSLGSVTSSGNLIISTLLPIAEVNDCLRQE